MWFHLTLAVLSAVAARTLWAGPGLVGALAVGFLALSGWQVFCAATQPHRPPTPVVLRLGGFAWTVEDFCRGWLITGETGAGKTLGGINTMLWQVSQRCPTWGGVCVDDKGLYADTLAAMLRQLGRTDDLLVLQVRPESAPADWRPVHTFNFLADPYLTFAAKAKIVCDVASSLGQRADQTFFRMQAQVQMEFAFHTMQAAGLPVTLETAYDLLTSDTLLEEVMEMLAQQKTPAAEILLDHYEGSFKAQPAEQLGGVKTTVANYLKHFTDPDIAAVFCPAKPTLAIDAIDRAKKICLSIPQRFHIERRYVNTLLKLAFYTHALRRFDLSPEARARANLLVFWAGEAPKVVTASDDGLSDYNVVDVIREARATFVGDTQSYTSLVPPMGDDKRAKVFIANMANRITFKAADEDSAKIAADTLGKRKIRKRTYGWNAGRRTTSWTDDEKYWIEPHEFRRLKKFEAVVQHCEHGFRRVTLPPCGADGKTPAWYRS